MACKLISKNLQRGISPQDTAADIKGVPCPHTSEGGLTSCPIAIWLELKDFPQEKIETALFKKEVRENACEAAPVELPVEETPPVETDPAQAVPTGGRQRLTPGDNR